MQKDFVILNKEEHSPIMVSIHSYDYPELLQLGYTVLFQGNKKSCMEIMRENEMELAY